MYALALYYLLSGPIPDCDCFVEVGEVCQVAADGGIVAEHFVFDYRFARAHRIVEVGLVIDGVPGAPRETSADTGRGALSANQKWNSLRVPVACPAAYRSASSL